MVVLIRLFNHLVIGREDVKPVCKLILVPVIPSVLENKFQEFLLEVGGSGTFQKLADVCQGECH